jgi:hypothetical protein
VLNGFGNTASFTNSIAIGNGASTTAINQVMFAGGLGNSIRLDLAAGTGVFEGGASTGTADYAEYFEWDDNNPTSDKRYGYAVSLVDDGKIEIGGKNIIGIISSTPGVVGNSAEMSWGNKYITNEWGIREQIEAKMFYSAELKKQIYIDENNDFYSKIPNHNIEKLNHRIENFSLPENAEFEIVTFPKLVDNYNSKESYIPRSKRKEWAVVGLLGQLRIRTAEKITSKFIDINSNGMAVNGTKYRVLKTIKDYDSDFGIVLIFFK